MQLAQTTLEAYVQPNKSFEEIVEMMKRSGENGYETVAQRWWRVRLAQISQRSHGSVRFHATTIERNCW